MERENSNYRRITKVGLSALLTGLVAATMIASSGCATPASIKYRRMLASQGNLNNGVYTELSRQDNDYILKTGISVNFKNAKELKEGAASALTAFGYGIIRSAFSEFWKPSKPEEFEYSGLTVLTGAGYRNGRTPESLGEITRYFSIAAVLVGGKGGSKTPQEQQAPAPAPEPAPAAITPPPASQPAPPAHVTPPERPPVHEPVTPVTPPAPHQPTPDPTPDPGGHNSGGG